MPMEAYMDESGIHSGAPRCLIAGCSGGIQKIRSFEKRWLEILLEFEIPVAVGFHAKTFFGVDKYGKRSGIYRTWSHQKSYDFMDAMIGAIGDNALNPVGAAITVGVFKDLPLNFRRWITGGIYDVERSKWKTSGAPSKPYFFAFHHALISGCRNAKSGVVVDFLFDRQEEFSGLALNMWNDLKKQPTKIATHLGGIGFYSRFERVSLQAADLIAYCGYYVEEYREDAEMCDVRYAISKLLSVGLQVSDLDKAIAPLYAVYPAQLRAQDENDQNFTNPWIK